MKTVRCFIPGKKFPAISITGSRCELCCPHCMGHPLLNMLPAGTPEKLLSIASDLDNRQAIGFLLSGGCDSNGILPIEKYLPAVRTIKDKYNLKINAHIGYPRRKDAQSLVASGIDVFSITFPMSDDVGLRVLRVPNALTRYYEAYDSLTAAGAEKVIPHVLIGLTNLEEEIKGLKRLSQSSQKSIVIISFHPLSGTPMHDIPPTNEKHIIDFVRECRVNLPGTEIAIGCMRQRGLSKTEKYLIENLIDGIVMPSREAIKCNSDILKIEKLDGCCALYL